MENRLLGNSGTVVSRFALGTMYFGGETSEADAFAIMDAYVEAGGNFIDTANVYMGGQSEAIVGRWFNSRPVEITDRIVLTTKGRNSIHQGPNAAALSRPGLQRLLDESLKNLGCDHIDLYQLHSWDPLTPVEETIRFLDDATRAGKIHYVGLSNFLGWQLQLFVSTARQLGVALPISLQQQYSLLSRESEWEIIPAALHNGIGLLPWSPLAGGFLTGKYQRATTPASGSRAGSEKALYQWTSAEYAESERNWATIEAVVRLSNEIGATPSQVSLAWVADQPSVTAPIFGARTLAQLKHNLGASDLHLSTEATAMLNEVSRPQSGGYPYGAFGEGQRTRRLDGKNGLVDVVGGGSRAPLGKV
ncbi:aldo/keto reductase [Bordetella sp. N]|uniref:aldo/keto reductase n=1 Tax=Bordetella sp. N TaxID=1746199 RepID=UPI00070ABF06|nr:aldo/keto reductase [Bordetella sp. N]ALM84227.1 dehydratase [Bordetella sp. N]